MGNRAKVFIVALTLCSGVMVGASPAHGADTTENRLCQNTGFGYYGVTDHVHAEAASGSYHISPFRQASAWTYYGTGNYCYQNSANLACSAYVYEVVYQNGSYIGTTAV